jgi:hypothetical protein
MSKLRLSPFDLAEYARLCLSNEKIKQASIRAYDIAGAKKARQANTALYKEYESKQLPEKVPSYQETHHKYLSLEQRIRRLEIELGLL